MKCRWCLCYTIWNCINGWLIKIINFSELKKRRRKYHFFFFLYIFSGLWICNQSFQILFFKYTSGRKFQFINFRIWWKLYDWYRTSKNIWPIVHFVCGLRFVFPLSIEQKFSFIIKDGGIYLFLIKISVLGSITLSSNKKNRKVGTHSDDDEYYDQSWAKLHGELEFEWSLKRKVLHVKLLSIATY